MHENDKYSCKIAKKQIYVYNKCNVLTIKEVIFHFQICYQKLKQKPTIKILKKKIMKNHQVIHTQMEVKTTCLCLEGLCPVKNRSEPNESLFMTSVFVKVRDTFRLC